MSINDVEIEFVKQAEEPLDGLQIHLKYSRDGENRFVAGMNHFKRK